MVGMDEARIPADGPSGWPQRPCGLDIVTDVMEDGRLIPRHPDGSVAFRPDGSLVGSRDDSYDDDSWV